MKEPSIPTWSATEWLNLRNIFRKFNHSVADHVGIEGSFIVLYFSVLTALREWPTDREDGRNPCMSLIGPTSIVTSALRLRYACVTHAWWLRVQLWWRVVGTREENADRIDSMMCFSMTRHENDFHGHLKGSFLDDAVNQILQFENNDLVDGRSVFNTYSKFSVNGITIQSRSTQKSKRNSYTVEFLHGDSVSFGYVDLFVNCRGNSYAIIQKLETEEWSVCVRQENDLSIWRLARAFGAALYTSFWNWWLSGSIFR